MSTTTQTFSEITTPPYIASPQIEQALKVAQMLNRPLLLTGEPGTGKTKFVEHITFTDKSYSEKVEKFYTKSTSLSQDLFYDFDTVAYFASKQLHENMPITKFIRLNALGKAICNALSQNEVTNILKNSFAYKNILTETERENFIEEFIKQLSNNNKKTIVLIDEIDKAPRDFPNDILNEIDDGYKFKIKELDIEFSLCSDDKKTEEDYRNKVLVIITSNYEKALPEPFLRRCAYFNIEFPNVGQLLEIVTSKHYCNHYKEIEGKKIDKVYLDSLTNELKNIATQIEAICNLRKLNDLKKKPSTSEILDFFYCAIKQEIELNKPINARHELISTLIKKVEDLKALEK